MTFGAGIARTIMPKGFFSSGLNSGVRRYRPDVGLITSETDATAAAVYTLNTCLGAHIAYCKEILPASNIRALITNSGQANTAVGSDGAVDNLKMAESVAQAMKVSTHQVLTASTGVIGKRLDLEKITAIIPQLVDTQVDTAESFATAIMTTDLIPKTVTTTVKLSEGEVRITGIAKGSGMIHPNMATMLGYILTDLALEPGVAQELLERAVQPSFNMISVDGETSTNDTVFLMANGQAKVKLASDADYKSFLKTLTEVAVVLAKSVVRDGEGATKVIEVELKGATDDVLARKWARSLTVSPLIKTAIHGCDPNWGRILARLGAEGVPAELLQKVSLSVQGIALMVQGKPQPVDLSAVSTLLKKEEIQVCIDLHAGPVAVTAWGCDMSRKYVDINAEYMT